jgi:multidrug resistance efflux pump
MTGPTNTATAVTDEKLDLTGTAPELAEPEVEPPVPQAEPEVPGKRKMKRSTRRTVAIIVVIAVLAALGFGGAYVLYSRNFVSTDNAQVDGNKIEINAPVSGVLVDWQGSQGNSVTRNQAIGRVEIGSSTGVQMPINSPENGTIAVNNAVNGEWVTAGTNLATAYDLNKIYVTARVDETDITAVHLGARVDISVGGFSGTPVTGVVTEIQGAAADEFSLFPQSNSTGNFLEGVGA